MTLATKKHDDALDHDQIALRDRLEDEAAEARQVEDVLDDRWCQPGGRRIAGRES